MLLLAHRACRSFILLGTSVPNQEQADHNTSSAGHYRHAASDLRRRCEITTWLGLVILLLRLEMTMPGMARKPTFTESTTVDCDIVRVKHKNPDLCAVVQ
jgi:hypothetical protein